MCWQALQTPELVALKSELRTLAWLESSQSWLVHLGMWQKLWATLTQTAGRMLRTIPTAKILSGVQESFAWCTCIKWGMMNLFKTSWHLKRKRFCPSSVCPQLSVNVVNFLLLCRSVF
jgi:hypothetical protein